MCGSDRVNSGDIPRWTILSQAAKAEGATTIPDRGVGSSEPKRPALRKQVMIWSDLHGNVQRPLHRGAATEVATCREHQCGDFQSIVIVPNRFMRARDILVLEKSHMKVAVLRPMTSVELSKTGDSRKGMLICEQTLQIDNEAALGILPDCTTS